MLNADVCKENKDILMARRIAAAVKKAGGRTYYVGGFVRDGIIGRENKDIDIEIHGIGVDKLKEILDSCGERLEMGASFGIMALRHYGLDICLPRFSTVLDGELKTYIDPFVGERNAACHRDFTMNALMQDVLSGEILDFFGGCSDIKNRVIRHVDDDTFGEDPLRVLRAAQFAARFNFSLAGETVDLISKIKVDGIAFERIMCELEKSLLKAERPSLFFENLKETEQLSIWFPEVEALCGVEQQSSYHPEGDVWRHTMLVLDAAAKMSKDAEEPLAFMLSALCHDFGKPEACELKNGFIHFYGHENKSVPVAKQFLQRITKDIKLKKYVLNMVELHMRPNSLVANGSATKSYMYLFDKAVSPNDLLLLAKADHIGRTVTDEDLVALNDSYLPVEQKLKDMLIIYKARMKEPYLTGDDLIKAGFEPGPQMGEALKHAHKLRLAGASKQEQLRHTVWIMNKKGENNNET